MLYVLYRYVHFLLSFVFFLFPTRKRKENMTTLEDSRVVTTEAAGMSKCDYRCTIL
jgi:hypothetical protein